MATIKPRMTYAERKKAIRENPPPLMSSEAAAFYIGRSSGRTFEDYAISAGLRPRAKSGGRRRKLLIWAKADIDRVLLGKAAA